MRLSRMALLVLVCSVALAGPAFAEDQIRVPLVEGKDVDAAIKTLEDLGLDIRLIEVAGPKVDIVDAQDPRPGTKMRRRGIVTIRVGIAARIETRLPDVRGKRIEEALKTLAPAYDVMVVPMPAKSGQVGKVVRTDPAGGATVWFRAPVTIYVAERMEGTQPVPGSQPAVPDIPGTPAQPEVPPVPDTPVVPTAPVHPVAPPPPGRGAPADLSPPGAPTGFHPQGDLTRPVVRTPGTPQGPSAPPTSLSVVPSLLGKPQHEALALLARAGLVPEPWYFTTRNRIWHVYSQLQRAGTRVPTGSHVAYRISIPAVLPARLPMPFVEQRPLGDAIRVLGMVGLKVRIRGGGPVNDSGALVLRQMPTASSDVSPGSVVTLELAPPIVTPPVPTPPNPNVPPTGGHPDSGFPGGPVPGTPTPPTGLPEPTVQVVAPSVIGLTASEAQALLTKNGLRGEILRTPAPHAAPGRVFEQEPPAGLPAETKVVRIVLPDASSAGQPGALYAKVPDVVNRSPADAEAAINATGLRAVIQRGPEVAGVPSIAFAQSHHPGALIRHGTLVTIMVGAPPEVTAAQPTATPVPGSTKKRDPIDRVGRFFRKTHKKAWGKVKDLFK